jgi:hypothetical protein
MKKKNQAVTPVGTFTRYSETEYKFVKVWSFPRCRQYEKTRASVGKPAQWHKDHGYEVTYHGSREAAEKAKCKWNSEAELIGIFPTNHS